MQKTIAQHEAESLAQVVAHVDGSPVTRGTLSAAFDRVADRANWKMPIDRVVEIESDFAKHVIAEAVVFFTGSRATFVPVEGSRKPNGARKYHVQAAGYYAAVGA